MNGYNWKDKIISGRFFLTVTAAICFFWLIKSLCHILVEKSVEIEVEHIILLVTNLALVIQNVFTSYFNKKRENGNGNGQ